MPPKDERTRRRLRAALVVLTLLALSRSAHADSFDGLGGLVFGGALAIVYGLVFILGPGIWATVRLFMPPKVSSRGLALAHLVAALLPVVVSLVLIVVWLVAERSDSLTAVGALMAWLPLSAIGLVGAVLNFIVRSRANRAPR